MKIKKIISQHRRDFWAIYICEHCGYESEKQSGYDDSYFHNNVIPKMLCPKCGKSANENYKALKPKYDDNTII
jgi:predicted RNA-binding Zn-ribbon protein involved in translation (DUF1610 family)